MKPIFAASRKLALDESLNVDQQRALDLFDPFIRPWRFHPAEIDRRVRALFLHEWKQCSKRIQEQGEQ